MTEWMCITALLAGLHAGGCSRDDRLRWTEDVRVPNGARSDADALSGVQRAARTRRHSQRQGLLVRVQASRHRKTVGWESDRDLSNPGPHDGRDCSGVL